MPFIIQVKRELLGSGHEWLTIRASNQPKPYKYETREEAERALRIFYPDQARIEGMTRVVEVKE